MPKTLADMRRRVRKALGGLDEDDLSTVDLDGLINTSIEELSDKFPFREKEKVASFVTSIGFRSYDLPTGFESIRSLSISDLTTNLSTKLVLMTTDVYETRFDSDVDNYGFPTNYFREGDCIKLWPTPDNIYTITLRYNKPLEDLINESDTPNMPQNWHEIVELGAIWRGFIDQNDWQRSNFAKNTQISLLNTTVPVEAKEERDNRYAGVEVIRNGYDDFVQGF